MSHSHDHGRPYAGHSHGVSSTTRPGWLAVALAINVVLLVVEVVVGLLANSLALLSDAAHLLTDVGAIGLALFAVRLASRPPSGGFTFGLRRGEILSAQINGVTLLLLAGFIAFEAIGRLDTPPDVAGGSLIFVGLLGAAGNGAAAWALSRANRASLNVEGAYLHNLADLYSSLAAAVAGGVILATGLHEADGIAALTVAALMVHGGWGLLRDSGRVLLEAAPKGMDPSEVGRSMAEHPGIEQVHDLHVWEVTSGFPALSAHVVVASGADCHGKRRELQRLLLDRFQIEHTTLQVDHAPRSGPLEIDLGGHA
ncbi:MAG: cation diffusion facilitator family transporter [Actinomycetota bacterium]|nr:cation diffusion facilitator family transporter [Actinomycetota bacterium]